MKNRVLANTSSQVASRILVIAISLLTTGLLTRIFGAGKYGDYVFITSIVLMFVGLTDLGTTIIGVRESSAKKELAPLFFGNILSLRLILSFCLFFLFNLLVHFLPQFAGLRLPAFLASFILPFLVLRTIAEAILQTNLRLDLSSLLEVFASLFFLLLLVLSYFSSRFSLSYLMIFWSFSALLSGFFGFFISRRYLRLKLLWRPDTLKKILKESFPLGVYLLIYSVYDRGIDSFFLKTFSGPAAVGFYGLAYKIHGNLILGAAFLMNSLFPLLPAFKEDKVGLQKTFEKAFTLLFITAFLVVVLVWTTAPWIVRVIAGRDFAPSVIALRILLGATFFSYLNHLVGYSLVALGEQKSLLKYSLISLAINFIFNLIFIPYFSFVAAAGVTILTELVLWIITQNFLNQKFGLKYSLTIFGQNFKNLINKRENFFEK